MDFSKWTDAQVCNALLYLANHRLLYTRGVSEDHSRLLVGLVYKLRSLGVLTQPQICAAKLRLPLYERHIQGYEIPQVIVPGQSPCRFLLHNRHKLRIYSPFLVAKRLSALTGLEWDSERCFYTCDATRRNAHVLLEFSFVPDARASAWMEGEAPKPPLVDLSALKMQLKHYQVEGASFIVSRNGRALLSDEMGCLTGDTQISVRMNRATKKMCLSKFHDLYHKRRDAGATYEISVRALKDDYFGPVPVRDVLYSGIRDVYRLTLEDGKSLKATEDHEILTDNGYTPLGSLAVGDNVVINGTLVCKSCGSSKDIITSPSAKYRGLCRTCMYKYYRDGKKNKGDEESYAIDKDGYKRLYGKKYRRHPNYVPNAGLMEHIYVMSCHLGRPLDKGEVIHHKDGNKLNNSIENLMLLSVCEHAKIHAVEKTKNLHRNFKHWSSSEVVMVPSTSKVKSIEYVGAEIVYDIKMEAPYHNFIANGIVVHNCGKTAQAIAWAWYSNLTKVCVCCPASLKENWAREITMWTGEESICQIFGKRVTVELENSIRASKWIIINYDLVDAWKEVLSQAGIQAYILDEAQAIKNWTPPKKVESPKKKSVTKRAAAVVELTKQCPHVIAISGTPFENRPIELFPVLHILDPVLFSSRVAYGKRFCDLHLNSFGGYDMTGASNLQEFNKLLRDTYMIRRRKVDVLQELPEKSRVVIPLRLEKSQRAKYQQAEDQFVEWLMFNRAQRDTNLTKSQVLDQFVEWVMSDDADNGEMQVTKAVSMIKANALKQLAALAKMPLVIDWIDTYLENQSKLVVFAGHHEVIDILSKEYKGRCVVIDGRTPVTQRQGIVDAFQNDPKVNLFIGNIRAAGTGLTLTAAQDTVTVELDWNPAYHMQAEDRVHRIGQRNAVTAYYLLAKDTFETRVAEVLDKKQQILSMVLNGTPSDCAPLAKGSK